MKESEFQRQVIALAALRKWRVVHFRPARVIRGGKESWRTPVEGHNGFVDLVLARGGVVLHCELKTSTGRLSDDQQAWREAIGPSWRLWRPADWDAIVSELM
jgi:hypothetical protein